MRDTSSMPARICVDEVGGDFPVAYIRADIVERMAEALETAAARFNLMGGVGLVNGADPKVGYREAMQALTSYREASNDKA